MRLPGDRELDQLAGGVLWRKIVARGIVLGAVIALFSLINSSIPQPWWYLPSAIFAGFVLVQGCRWVVKNFNG